MNEADYSKVHKGTHVQVAKYWWNTSTGGKHGIVTETIQEGKIGNVNRPGPQTRVKFEHEIMGMREWWFYTGDLMLLDKEAQ